MKQQFLSFLRISTAFSVMITAQTLLAQPDFRVRQNGTGDGSSWDNACSLQFALQNAQEFDVVWVAAGTYVPGSSSTDKFDLANRVTILGGFPATGNPGPNDRDPDPATNGTVLSGDLDGEIQSNVIVQASNGM